MLAFQIKIAKKILLQKFCGLLLYLLLLHFLIVIERNSKEQELLQRVNCLEHYAEFTPHGVVGGGRVKGNLHIAKAGTPSSRP